MEVGRQLAEAAPLGATAQPLAERERLIQEAMAEASGAAGEYFLRAMERSNQRSLEAALGRAGSLPAMPLQWEEDIHGQNAVALVHCPVCDREARKAIAQYLLCTRYARQHTEEFNASVRQSLLVALEHQGCIHTGMGPMRVGVDFWAEGSMAMTYSTAAPSDEPPLTFDWLRETVRSIPEPMRPWQRDLLDGFHEMADQQLLVLWAQPPSLPFLRQDVRGMSGELAQQKAREQAAELYDYLNRPNLLHTVNDEAHRTYGGVDRVLFDRHAVPEIPWTAIFCECGRTMRYEARLHEDNQETSIYCPQCRKIWKVFEIEWERFGEE
jgi:hypothetical protein